MEETHGGVLKDIVDRRGDGQLRQLDNLRVEALDLAGAGEVARIEVLARLVDLIVTQSSQVGRGESLCCPVTMAVEDVSSKDGLGRLRSSEEGESGESNGRLHDVQMNNNEGIKK